MQATLYRYNDYTKSNKSQVVAEFQRSLQDRINTIVCTIGMRRSFDIKHTQWPGAYYNAYWYDSHAKSRRRHDVTRRKCMVTMRECFRGMQDHHLPWHEKLLCLLWALNHDNWLGKHFEYCEDAKRWPGWY